MKKFETILYAIVLILALATIPMMALAETAVTESPYVDPFDLFTPLGESSNSDYGPCGQDWVAATKDGIVSEIHVNKGDSVLEGAPIVSIA